MPKLSLCAIVYNLENYIEACIKSMIEQGDQDYEIILVDNGSEDESIAICRRYTSLYPELIKLYELPRPTVPARAHAFALEIASGEYVHLIDGDDMVAEGYLAEIMKIINTVKPDLIMGSFKCLLEPGANNYFDVDILQQRINETSFDEAIEYLIDLPYFNRHVWRFVVHKRLIPFGKLNLEHERLIVSDNIRSTIWLLKAKSLYYYDGPFYYYRRRLGSTVASENHALTMDYAKELVAVTEIIEGFPEGERSRAYKLQAAQMGWHLRLFYAGYNRLTISEKKQLAEYFDSKVATVNQMDNFKCEYLDKWVDQLRLYGSLAGMLSFYNNSNAKLISEVKSSPAEKGYIFPAGKYGEDTLKLLIMHGISIAGFIDNDSVKEGSMVEGLPCIKPETLLENGEIDQIIIIIATVYDKLRPIFMNQLLELGIKQSQVVIRE